MNIHKRPRLTLLDRQDIWRLYQARLWKNRKRELTPIYFFRPALITLFLVDIPGQ